MREVRGVDAPTHAPAMPDTFRTSQGAVPSRSSDVLDVSPTHSGSGRIAATAQRVRGMSVPGRIVAVAAVLSAIAAVVVKHLLFTHLSIDNDEALYRFQAQTIASGHLFAPAPRPATSYAPWLAAVVDGHYVLKYTPIVPAIFAVSMMLTGGVGAALAGVAAAAVVVTYLLGVEVLRDRRAAALAAVLFALSPLVFVQSGLLLPYLPVLVLLELAVYGLVRGLRRGRAAVLVGAGLATGFAASVRPYDALFFLLPPLVWGIRAHRDRWGWLVRWVALGLVPPAAVLLASNAAATGSPLRLPFALLEPEDKIGFGIRRLYPSDRAHHFGIVEGLAGLGNHLYLLGGWALGGVVLAVLAVTTVARRRAAGPAVALAAGGLLLAVGYVAFWGAWNAADLWGGIRYVGPFYLMPVMVPLVLLGARGLLDLAESRPRALVGVGAVGLGASALALAVALPANATFTRHDGELASAIATVGGRPLILVDTDPQYLMHPSSMIANPPDLDGRVLYAVRRGMTDLAVAADHPSRPAYGLRISYTWNHTPGAVSVARIERLTTTTGRSVTADVRLTPQPGWRSARLVEYDHGMRRSYPVDATSPSTLSLTVDRDGVQVNGAMLAPTVAHLKPTTDGSVTLFLSATMGRGSEQLVDRARVSVAPGSDDGVRVLGPSGQVAAAGGQAGAPAPLEVRLR
jgi:4-amino-4-deoxy-L-arabinose transferase-like glycosyltransferase